MHIILLLLLVFCGPTLLPVSSAVAPGSMGGRHRQSQSPSFGANNNDNNNNNNGMVQLKTPLGMKSLRSAGTQFVHSDVSGIRRRAQVNDPEALYFLGIMHYYGNAEGIEKNDEEAIRYFKTAADLGHLQSQVNLGMLLLSDASSNRQNSGQAVSYFTRAAENGDSDAQWCLGRVYYEGRIGRSPDFGRALDWFHKSAQAGNAMGLFHMGIMHEYGLGVQQDFLKAGRFYSEAADKDNLDAAYYLALLHAYGRGHPQDIHKASLIFKRAAESGHAPSQYFLGVIFLYGQGGFPRDYDMAFYWMDKAANSPSADTASAAKRALLELRNVMEQSKARMKTLSQRFASGPRGGPETSEKIFTALDADMDGRVSRDEFNVEWHSPPASVTFSREDANDDGFLSWDEFNGPNTTTVNVENATIAVAEIIHNAATFRADTPSAPEPINSSIASESLAMAGSSGPSATLSVPDPSVGDNNITPKNRAFSDVSSDSKPVVPGLTDKPD